MESDLWAASFTNMAVVSAKLQMETSSMFKGNLSKDDDEIINNNNKDRDFHKLLVIIRLLNPFEVPKSVGLLFQNAKRQITLLEINGIHPMHRLFEEAYY